MTKFNSLPTLFSENTSNLSETELQSRQRTTEFVLDQAERDGLQVPQHARRMLEMYRLGELNIETQRASIRGKATSRVRAVSFPNGRT